MAWRRPGDKPLSEPIMVWLLTHICVTRHWVNSFYDIEYKIIKKISQIRCESKRRFHAYISLQIGLASVIAKVSNDVTIPCNFMLSNSFYNNAKELTANTREWDRNRLEIYGSVLGHNSISSCTKAKPWIFGSVYFKTNPLKLLWRILLSHMLKITVYSVTKRDWSQMTTLLCAL